MAPLLYLAHRIPYPPDKGDKIRSFHVLRHLASRFEIYLGCFSDGEDDQRHVPILRDLCAEVFCLPVGRKKLASAWLMALARKQSLSEAYYHDPRMTNWVSETLGKRRIGSIFVFCSAMAPYAIAHAAGRRLVIDMVDVDSRKWGEYARSGSSLLRPLFRFEEHRVQALEERAARAGDRILFVSRSEAEVFAKMLPDLAARAACMTNGVDTGYFDPHASHNSPFEESALNIVFTGAMDYRPNVDAVTWFARECFPAVRKAAAGAQFWIVGSNPVAAVGGLSREEGIHVTGAVPDIRPYLAHSACSVAPLRIARGLQNKVLEAMAMERPVVLTSAALEGLEAEHGREVLVANDPRDFAERVCEVLSGRWNEIGRAARDFVERHHRWKDSLDILDDLFVDERTSNEAPICPDAKILAGAA